MEKNVIEATKRSVIGKKVGVLRREGKLPGVIYGHNFDSEPILMDSKAATKVLNSVTSSSIVTIVIDGKSHAALVREKQKITFVTSSFTLIFRQFHRPKKSAPKWVSSSLVWLRP